MRNTKTEPGSGCTNGEDVARIEAELLALIDLPTLRTGMSRGMVTMGLSAAERILELARATKVSAEVTS